MFTFHYLEVGDLCFKANKIRKKKKKREEGRGGDDGGGSQQWQHTRLKHELQVNCLQSLSGVLVALHLSPSHQIREAGKRAPTGHLGGDLLIPVAEKSIFQLSSNSSWFGAEHVPQDPQIQDPQLGVAAVFNGTWLPNICPSLSYAVILSSTMTWCLSCV